MKTVADRARVGDKISQEIHMKAMHHREATIETVLSCTITFSDHHKLACRETSKKYLGPVWITANSYIAK
jgi:hypothetical protein